MIDFGLIIDIIDVGGICCNFVCFIMCDVKGVWVVG